jgi:hypothetical protein
MKGPVKESHNVTFPSGVGSLSFVLFKNSVNLHRFTFCPEHRFNYRTITTGGRRTT